MLTKISIVQVGGSLTGLMHGIVVKRLGHNVRIFEQYESSTRQGQAAGISAMEYGTAFLKQYDLLAEQPYAVSCPGVQVLDKNAKVKTQLARPLTMTSWNVLYYRLRANFDGLTSTYYPKAPPATANDGNALYEHGKSVTNVKYADGDVTVEYADNSGGGTTKPDLVIAADGSTSRVRQLLLPDLQRTYAGYAIWRGTVLERDLSKATRDLFQTKTTLMTIDGGYIALSVVSPSRLKAIEAANLTTRYTIPGDDGTLQPGERLLNYVWYVNYSEDSPELKAAMTDVTGKRHHNTLPIGKMSPAVWDKQKAIAAETLPAPYSEIISKTMQPFITTVTDIASPQASFFNGKLLLVGDALVPFRPHVACSTNQAALNALLLGKLLKKEITLAQWESRVMGYAHVTRLRSISWGCWYQVGYLSFGVSKARYLFAATVDKIRGYWYG